jgi:aminopeptidase N
MIKKWKLYWIISAVFILLSGCVTLSSQTQIGPLSGALQTAILHPLNLTAGDRYTPELGNSGYDIQHYTLKLDLTPGRRSLNGEVAISAIATMDELKQISLDFIGFDVKTVAINGLPAPFFRHKTKLMIQLPGSFSVNEAFLVTIQYQGSPPKNRSKYHDYLDYLGLQAPGDSLYVASEPDGARNWFPCNDHPRDKATFRFELTVPEGYTAIANGTLIEARIGSTSDLPESKTTDLFVWEHRFPMATYLATIVAGKYRRIESVSPKGVLMRHYIWEKYQEDFEKSNAHVPEALDWMSEKFGAYPFEEFGYTLIKADKRWALETQTNVLVDREFIREKVLVHEMAHMWFGNWVSLDSWREMWRNEGFATYVQLLWEYRDKLTALDKEMETESKNPPKAFFPLGEPPHKFLFDRSVYTKGALFAHDLRKTMGDEAFFRGLRLYFERFGGRTATDADFRVVLEEASGMPLEELFNKWLK